MGDHQSGFEERQAELAKIHETLDQSFDEIADGKTISGDDAIAQARALIDERRREPELPVSVGKASVRAFAGNVLRQASVLHRSIPFDVVPVEFTVEHETLIALRLLRPDNDVRYAVQEDDTMYRDCSMHEAVIQRRLFGIPIRPTYNVPEGEIRLTVRAK